MQGRTGASDCPFTDVRRWRRPCASQPRRPSPRSSSEARELVRANATSSRSRWSIPSSASPSWASRRSKPPPTSPAFSRRTGFTVTRGVAGMPTAFVASWGSGKPGHRLHGRYRRSPGNFAEARRGLPRSAHPRRSRPRRRPQRRTGGECHRRPCGEAAHAEVQDPRHDPRLPRRRRGTARQPHLHGQVPDCFAIWT